ncbi:MAG: tetratricopeptide repeat protein [Alphaproteobacteria bacterium]|nr:tetratricopeptide repeat protein [Alphaproteobacteria bacterium]
MAGFDRTHWTDYPAAAEFSGRLSASSLSEDPAALNVLEEAPPQSPEPLAAPAAEVLFPAIGDVVLVESEASALLESGALREAVAFIERAIEQHPGSRALHLLLGAALLRAERPQEARRVLREAKALGPPDANVEWHFAAALSRCGMSLEAELSARIALDLAPDSAWAAAAMIEALQAQCRFVEAAAWAPRAQALFQAEGLERRRTAPDVASIPASFLPKSGGTYLGLALERMGFAPVLSGLGAANWDGALAPDFLRTFMEGGAFAHTHFPASGHNVGALLEAGVRRYWVHVRDPRQVAVSSFYHMQGQGQGDGAFAAIRLRDTLRVLQEEARTYSVASWDDYRRLLIDLAFPRAQTWIRQWVEAAENTAIDILFTTQTELRRDAAGLMRRVFDHFGVPLEVRLPPVEDGANRFRSGREDEWRDFFRPAELERIAALADRDLFERFGWGP